MKRISRANFSVYLYVLCFMPPKFVCFEQQKTQFYLCNFVKMAKNCLYSYNFLITNSVKLPFHSQYHLTLLQEACQSFHKTKMSLFFLSGVKVKSKGCCLLKKVETTFQLPLMICLALALLGTWIPHVPKEVIDKTMNDVYRHHICHKHLSSSSQE